MKELIGLTSIGLEQSYPTRNRLLTRALRSRNCSLLSPSSVRASGATWRRSRDARFSANLQAESRAKSVVLTSASS